MWGAQAHSRKCLACVENPPAGGSDVCLSRDLPPPFYDEVFPLNPERNCIHYLRPPRSSKGSFWARATRDQPDANVRAPALQNVGEEFLGDNLSMVFHDDYKPLLRLIEKGELGPDDDLVKPEFRAMVKTGMTGLQSAAAMADIPMMRAMLRKGARIDRFSSGGSLLQMLIGMMLMQVLDRQSLPVCLESNIPHPHLCMSSECPK